jgi:hypothetical protein
MVSRASPHRLAQLYDGTRGAYLGRLREPIRMSTTGESRSFARSVGNVRFEETRTFPYASGRTDFDGDLNRSAHHADFPKAVIRAVFMYGVIDIMFAA